MRAHLPIGIEMVYNCVIVGITLKRGVSKMGQIKGGFLRCGSAIASSIALMSASAVFAQESGSATSEARAESDIIVTGTRVRTPGLTPTSPISAVEGEQISLQRAVTIEDFSVKMQQLAGGVNSDRKSTRLNSSH